MSPRTSTLIGAAFAALVIPALQTRAGDTPTLRANDFLNSIGVCTHLSQGEDHVDKVTEALRYLGLRRIRDDGEKSRNAMQNFIYLHQTLGVKVCLLPVTTSLETSIAQYETLAAEGALLAVEGPNEPNNFKVTYKGATNSDKTSLPVAQFQAALYAAVKANPKLAGIPVFHSSEAGGSEPDNCGLQYLVIPSGANTRMPDGTKFADYANTHNYVCDHLKGITEDNIAWKAEDPTLNSTWDGLYTEYGHTWWGKGFEGYSSEALIKLPRVTTETGWSTKVGGHGHPAAITEEQQGKLFLNLYLAAARRGWTNTFIYMLHDSDTQGYWGLVHVDYSHKASADYIHNLTTILADDSSDFKIPNFAYAIPNEPETVHDLLLVKKNGLAEICIWGELAKGSADITVNFRPALYVKVYDPTVGSESIKTYTNISSLPLTLSDHPLILEIPITASPPAPAPSTEPAAPTTNYPKMPAFQPH